MLSQVIETVFVMTKKIITARQSASFSLDLNNTLYLFVLPLSDYNTSAH